MGGRPPRPLTTNKPPSLSAHTKIAGRCGKAAEFLDEMCKSSWLPSTAALVSTNDTFPESLRISAFLG